MIKGAVGFVVVFFLSMLAISSFVTRYQAMCRQAFDQDSWAAGMTEEQRKVFLADGIVTVDEVMQVGAIYNKETRNRIEAAKKH